MNIDNITSDSMSLTYNGKAMLIKVYEQEIERLTAESTKWESKFYDEAKKVDRAIEYLESYNTDFKNCRFGEAPISIRELGDLLDILKGSE